MVRILSTGEIVQDDDPRASQSSSRGSSSRQPGQRQRQGYIRHDEDNQQGQGMYGGQQVNIFDSLNQRLLAAGIPRFNIGPYTVEPIVLVGFCLAGLLLGVKGLLFGAVLFFVAKMSTGGIPSFGAAAPGGAGRGGGGGQGSGGGGGGHRLGR